MQVLCAGQLLGFTGVGCSVCAIRTSNQQPQAPQRHCIAAESLSVAHDSGTVSWFFNARDDSAIHQYYSGSERAHEFGSLSCLMFSSVAESEGRRAAV